MNRKTSITRIKLYTAIIFLIIGAMVFSIFLSPAYCAELILGSAFVGEFAKYFVYIHGDKLYYALRDGTSNFDTNNLVRCAYIINILAKDDTHIQEDLLKIYKEPSCEEHKIYLLGLLYNAGVHEYVHSKRPYIKRVVDICIKWKYHDKPPDGISIRNNYGSRTSYEHDVFDIIVAAVWTIGEVGDPHYLDSIRDILWRFNKTRLVVSDCIRTISKIDDPRGKVILQELLQTFGHLDDDIRNDAEKVVAMLSKE